MSFLHFLRLVRFRNQKLGDVGIRPRRILAHVNCPPCACMGYHLVCLRGLPPCVQYGLPPSVRAWASSSILYGTSPHLNELISCVLPSSVPPRGTVQCTCYHLVCMHGLPSSCILPHNGACMQLRIIVKSHMYAFEKCYFPLGFFPERSYCIFIYALHIRDMIFSFSKAGSDVSITNLRLDACSSNEWG